MSRFNHIDWSEWQNARETNQGSDHAQLMEKKKIHKTRDQERKSTKWLRESLELGVQTPNSVWEGEGWGGETILPDS